MLYYLFIIIISYDMGDIACVRQCYKYSLEICIILCIYVEIQFKLHKPVVLVTIELYNYSVANLHGFCQVQFI